MDGLEVVLRPLLFGGETVLRSQHRCPDCGQPLGLSRDMWGEFYLCQSCGLALEQEEELLRKGKASTFLSYLPASGRPVATERR